MYQSLITEIDAAVGILTLNKPERHNAFDDLLVAELTCALLELEGDARVRVIVISAAGKSFCAGNDLEAIARAANFSHADHQREARNLALLLTTLNELTKPTIARVQGPAYGPGVGIVAACDIALATYDALFALTDIKLGMLPAIISPYFVAAIGQRQAQRYLLTGERFSASEAYRLGLVHELLPGDDELDDAIAEIIDALQRGGQHAQAECKSLMRAVAGQPIDEATVEETVQRMTRVRMNDEGAEGLRAFVEKRKPNWIA